jgi:hypothetical protein
MIVYAVIMCDAIENRESVVEWYSTYEAADAAASAIDASRQSRWTTTDLSIMHYVEEMTVLTG